MAQKTNQREERSPIITLIGIIVIAVSTLVGYLLEQDSGGTEPVATDVPATQVAAVNGGFTGDVESITFEQGFGAKKDFWQVYFTAPTGSNDSATYTGGVDEQLIAAINEVQNTLDIAAFEWNNPHLTEAVVAAHERGVEVRMVVDDEHTIEDHEEALEDGEESPWEEIIEAGISFVDDSRSGLMHNKFMIMDSATVWTGSMNFTVNGTYRNNNNMLAMRAQRAVTAYQAEFNEMFVDGEFGSSRSEKNGVSFSQDGVGIQIIFSPEDEPVPALIDAINNAESSIRFMTFSFTLDEVGQAVLERANDGIEVQGLFNLVGSRTQYSELPLLFCAGLPILQDGNPYTLHHKVFIIDDEIVLTGSFNISSNATESNDENMVIIQDRDVAAAYVAEFERVQSQATTPPADEIECP
jgi:phosphatidylserine/phosphatidylglycerophosphate/cardiolipin synthase-like enzyme